MTAAKFKPFVFYVSGFALSNIAKTCFSFNTNEVLDTILTAQKTPRTISSLIVGCVFVREVKSLEGDAKQQTSLLAPVIRISGIRD
jgi:hypothetical protein